MPRTGSVQKTNKKKKKLELDFVRIALVCFTIYFVYTFICQQMNIHEYDVKIADVELKIDEANDRVEEIEELKKKVNSTEFIETVARTELGLIKPYEKIFIDVNK